MPWLCPWWWGGGIKVFIARVVKSSNYKAFKGSKKKNDAFPPRELLSSPQWLRFAKMESKACTKSVFTRDTWLITYTVLSQSVSLSLFGHWWSQAGGVMLWFQEVNSHCKLGLINRNKPNKIVVPNSYLQELLCAILNSGSYSVYT